jgi:hypothetical protein
VVGGNEMEGVAGRWCDGGSTAKPVDVAESEFGDECDDELRQSRVRGRVRLCGAMNWAAITTTPETIPAY